jgi:hypothetical protein
MRVSGRHHTIVKISHIPVYMDYVQRPKGSYVIRLLGNLMKPEDPMTWGF